MLSIAIVRRPSPLMQSGERTFVGRAAIDATKALQQHVAYCAALTSCGLEVRALEADELLPDCAFVEDCAVALPESALICRPGAASRLPEVDAVARALSSLRETIHTHAPATIEGGDILRLEKQLLVGRSSRTNAQGIALLRQWVAPLGYAVTEIDVHGCLHLKTACTFLPDGSLLANPEWVTIPKGLNIVAVTEDEPWAGNILLANQTIIAARNQRKTNQMLRERGFDLIDVDISEFQKAEGGVTCLSILLEQSSFSL